MTPTASASLSAPAWSADLELWSKATSFAEALTFILLKLAVLGLWPWFFLKTAYSQTKTISFENGISIYWNEIQIEIQRERETDGDETWWGEARMEAAEIALAAAISIWFLSEMRREMGGQMRPFFFFNFFFFPERG